MKKKSNRNRHTGHINAYKAQVINRGEKREIKGRVYFAAKLSKTAGISIVRTA